MKHFLVRRVYELSDRDEISAPMIDPYSDARVLWASVRIIKESKSGRARVVEVMYFVERGA